MPAISVVMSVYNDAEYLAQSIDSILLQTCRDFELIVVNDGSDDDTLQILKGFKDPRLRLVDRNENIGLTRALNLAISMSRGALIARQDSDDVSEPERLDRQREFMDANPEVAAVGSWAVQIDEDGDEIHLLERETTPADIRTTLTTENQFHHGSVMFRRSALERVGGYREQFQYAQDYDLFLRLSDSDELANLPLALYRKRHTSRTVSILHSNRQKSFSDLALKLAHQRSVSGSDDLMQGKEVEALLEPSTATPNAYVNNLVYMYLRSDNQKKARPYIRNSIKSSPYNVKHYLQYGMTFLNKDLRNRLFRLWDPRVG